jgi:hypothetical protein
MGKTIKATYVDKKYKEIYTNIFKSKQYTDCTLELQSGETMDLNKNILSVVSTVLKNNLKDEKKIKIEEKDEDLFKAYINFVYTGELDLKEEKYFDFLLLAHQVFILLFNLSIKQMIYKV